MVGTTNSQKNVSVPKLNKNFEKKKNKKSKNSKKIKKDMSELNDSDDYDIVIESITYV